jgi:hypothetical protein
VPGFNNLVGCLHIVAGVPLQEFGYWGASLVAAVRVAGPQSGLCDQIRVKAGSSERANVLRFWGKLQIKESDLGSKGCHSGKCG